MRELYSSSKKETSEARELNEGKEIQETKALVVTSIPWKGDVESTLREAKPKRVDDLIPAPLLFRLRENEQYAPVILVEQEMLIEQRLKY